MPHYHSFRKNVSDDEVEGTIEEEMEAEEVLEVREEVE